MYPIPYFINILPSLFLSKNDFSLLTDNDWKNFSYYINRHGLTSLFIEKTRQVNIDIPEHGKNLLIQSAKKIITRNLYIISVLSELKTFFDNDNIPFILFKGTALSQLLYDNPCLRHSVDIDLLMRPHDADKARNILLNKGAVEYGNVQHKFIIENMPHDKPLYFKNVLIEIHSKLYSGKKQYTFTNTSTWLNTIDINIGDNLYKTLNPVYYLFYLCSHAQHHLSTGRLKLLWYIDISILAERFFNNQLHEIISENIKTNPVKTDVITTLHIVKKYVNPLLDIKTETANNRDIIRSAKKFILLVKSKNVDNLDYYKGVWKSLSLINKSKYLFSIFYPSLSYIKSKHNITSNIKAIFLLFINPFRVILKTFYSLLNKPSR